MRVYIYLHNSIYIIKKLRIYNHETLPIEAIIFKGITTQQTCNDKNYPITFYVRLYKRNAIG